VVKTVAAVTKPVLSHTVLFRQEHITEADAEKSTEIWGQWVWLPATIV
jgi:hypothetical protein